MPDVSLTEKEIERLTDLLSKSIHNNNNALRQIKSKKEISEPQEIFCRNLEHALDEKKQIKRKLIRASTPARRS